MTSVQPLHRKRGRPASIVLQVFGEDLPDHSRRALYYRYAHARAWIAMTNAGLADKENRHPLPLRVMYQIGKRTRSDEEVLSLAWKCLLLRKQGWTTGQLLYWLREQ